MNQWERPTAADWADVLEKFPLFAGIRKRRLRKLVGLAQVVEFAPGDVVIAPDAPADSFYVILGGAARVIGRHAARTLGTGDYFGELAVLEEGGRSPTILATRELQVMRLPRRPFLELAKRDPRISLTMLQDIGSRFKQVEPAA